MQNTLGIYLFKITLDLWYLGFVWILFPGLRMLEGRQRGEGTCLVSG